MTKYQDEEEMDKLRNKADPKLKRNYELFALDPNESVTKIVQKKRRNFLNPKDPYLNGLNFKKNHTSVRGTGKTLDIIQPLDHSELLTKSKENINDYSKGLMNKYLDREKVYYNDKKPTNALSPLSVTSQKSKTNDDGNDEGLSKHN